MKMNVYLLSTLLFLPVLIQGTSLLDKRPPWIPPPPKCVDKVVNCQKYMALCGNSYIIRFMKENCQKTCGLCEKDLDECAGNNGGCQHKCTNTKKSHYCSCLDGFTLNGDQRTCTSNNLLGGTLVGGSSAGEPQALPYCYIPWCNDSPPVHPEDCEDIEFRLYTRASKDLYDILITNDTASVDSSPFDPLLPLLVIAHGWTENATSSVWMHQVKDGWLEKKEMNVILVQWAKPAGALNYCRAVKNTKCVGTKLANLLNFLKNYTGMQPSHTHLIGHSLGSQLVGIAGHLVPNLARITGMDPAGPGFYDVELPDRLDKGDANFVDVIHTSGGCIYGGYLGFLPECGDVDFYMNGGSNQTGCRHVFPLKPNATNTCGNNTNCWLNHVFGSGRGSSARLHLAQEGKYELETRGIYGQPIYDDFMCSHRRAHDYYVESLTSSEPSYGYQCDNYTTFQYGVCLNNLRNTIGYGVTPIPTGTFYSNTSTNSTFLTRSILVVLAVGGEWGTFHGSCYVGAILPNRTEETVDIMRKYDEVSSGAILTTLMTVPSGTILNTIQISGKYDYDPAYNPDYLLVNNIEAYDAYERSWYCVSGLTTLSNGVVNTFTPTPGRCS